MRYMNLNFTSLLILTSVTSFTAYFMKNSPYILFRPNKPTGRYAYAMVTSSV